MPKSTQGQSKRICENGAYFCKRDRNKAGTIGIYTCKGRQTVRVGSTNECSPEGQEISPEQLDSIEMALGRFVLTDLEAKKRERTGIVARDMLVIECLAIYIIARQEFHAEVIGALRAKIEATAGAPEAHLHKALIEQLPRAKEAARQEDNTLRSVVESVRRCWDGDGPKASEMDKAGQLTYVTTMRKIGYADSTIKTWLVRIFTALTHCAEEKRLLDVPKRVRADKWSIKDDESRNVVVFDMPELAAIFDAAWLKPIWWKSQNMSTHAPRPMTIVEATWLQIDLDEMAPRWKLNPPGKRLTKKRRPVIPICPTLAAEMRTWARDHIRIVTNDNGRRARTHTMFRRILRAAGVNHGSAKTMRSTIRTILALHGVPDAIADWFVGHAGDGSPTGDFYKAKLPQYMAACALVLELHLYTPLRSLCKRARFAAPAPGALERLRAAASSLPHVPVIDRRMVIERPFGEHTALPSEEQTPPDAFGEAFWSALRDNCVSKTRLTEFAVEANTRVYSDVYSDCTSGVNLAENQEVSARPCRTERPRPSAGESPGRKVECDFSRR